MHKLKDKLEGFICSAPGAITSIILAVSFAEAIRRAWGAYDFFPSFLLWWITGAFYLPVILSPFVAAFFAGSYAGKRFEKNWLGWVVGLLAWFLISGAVIAIASSIPGLGWRFHSFISSSGSGDYDY